VEKEEIIILKNIDITLDKLYKYLTKQPSRWVRIFNAVVAVVGVLGVIAIIDVIINWIAG